VANQELPVQGPAPWDRENHEQRSASSGDPETLTR
jgi:hypothetical protein